MLRPNANRRLLLGALVAAAAAAAACNGPPDDASPHEVEQQLAGTWLREYVEDGVKVRRILILEPGGKFREMSRTVQREAGEVEHMHAGEWHFDGTNLKRRYTSVDGEQPSAPAMPYATFEIKFSTRNEFIGLDRVRKREVTYRRVAEGTEP